MTVAAPKRNTPPIPRFYTAYDIAELLKVSTKTVRRWIDDNELAIHRFGRQVRVSDSDLSAFIRLRRGA